MGGAPAESGQVGKWAGYAPNPKCGITPDSVDERFGMVRTLRHKEQRGDTDARDHWCPKPNFGNAAEREQEPFLRGATITSHPQEVSELPFALVGFP